MVPGGAGFVRAIGEFVRRRLIPTRLSEQERFFLDKVELAAKWCSTRLWTAADRGQFEARLDELAADPNLYHVSREIQANLPEDVAELALTGPTQTEESALVKALPGQSAGLQRVESLTITLLDALRKLPATEGDGLPLGEGPSAQDDDPLAFLVDPGIPPQLAQLFFQSMRAGPCQYAFIQICIDKEPPEPWVAHALVECWEAALYACARYSASLPGIRIPDEVVPQSDRLDLEALEKKTTRFRASLKSITDDPASNDRSLIAPFGDPILD